MNGSDCWSALISALDSLSLWAARTSSRTTASRRSGGAGRRSRTALRGPTDEHQEDEALVDVAGRLWRAAGCGSRGPGSGATKRARAGTGPPHAEHVALLREAVRLGDRARILQLCRESSRRCGCRAAASGGSGRTSRARRRTPRPPRGVQHTAASIRIRNMRSRAEQRGRLQRAAGGLVGLAAHYLLQWPSRSRTAPPRTRRRRRERCLLRQPPGRRRRPRGENRQRPLEQQAHRRQHDRDPEQRPDRRLEMEQRALWCASGPFSPAMSAAISATTATMPLPGTRSTATPASTNT